MSFKYVLIYLSSRRELPLTYFLSAKHWHVFSQLFAKIEENKSCQPAGVRMGMTGFSHNNIILVRWICLQFSGDNLLDWLNSSQQTFHVFRHNDHVLDVIMKEKPLWPEDTNKVGTKKICPENTKWKNIVKRHCYFILLAKPDLLNRTRLIKWGNVIKAKERMKRLMRL